MGLYLLVAPWAMVKNLGWETGLVTAFISFIYLSVSEAGVEIERIFSHGSHENSLDFLCDTIKSNVEGIIQQAYYPQPVPISNLPNKIAQTLVQIL